MTSRHRDSPTPSGSNNATWPTLRAGLPWLLLGAPALLHVVLLCYSVALRLPYPFDLEWMEGGMLEHAERFAVEGIYVPASVHFVPYPYPPLYPAAVAALGTIFGVNYTLARAVSVMATAITVATIALAVASSAHDRERANGNRSLAQRRTSALLAVGIFAAAYPWVEGWYDLARVDSLFLALTAGGLLALERCCRQNRGTRKRIAACAALLASSFFCKQTGALFIVAGAALVLVRQPRRFVSYALVAVGVATLGTLAITWATDGWYYTYVFEVLASHHFSWERFFESFANVLGRFPAATAVTAAALIITLPKSCRQLPSASALRTWAWFAVVAMFAGAIGWAKSWAHFNAYMPAIATLAVTSGLGILVVTQAARRFFPGRHQLISVIGFAATAIVSAQLLLARWDPHHFVPTTADVAAGRRLIEKISSIDGNVFVPFHPWYGRLAGKKPYLHRMPALDVSYRPRFPIRGLEEAVEAGIFEAIIWDNRPIDRAFDQIRRRYSHRTPIPESMRPHVYSGAGSPVDVKGNKGRLLRPSVILWRPTKTQRSE